MFSKDQKQMAIAWTSCGCEKKEERCSRIAVPRLASRLFRTRAWSLSTLSPRRGCTRHEDSSCNIKVRLTSRERTSIRFFLLFFFFFLWNRDRWNSIWTNDCTTNLSSRNNESTNFFFFRTQACLIHDTFSPRYFFDMLWYVHMPGHRYNVASWRNDPSVFTFFFFFISGPIGITKLHLCSSQFPYLQFPLNK